MTSDPLLSALEISHSYPMRRRLSRRTAAEPRTRPAVAGVSFEVRRGEAFGIVGESGSGKSTIARIVSGLLSPTAGTVAFAGRPVYERSDSPSRSYHSKVQIVLQDPYSSLNPRAKVGTTLARPLIVRGRPAAERRRRVPELLELVGLPGDVARRYPSALSGGQRQRVAIARALALEPELLVLDEPTSALDLSTQGQIMNLLRRLQQQLGLTYVLVSHNLALVAYFCERTMVLYEGKCVELGAATELYYRPTHEYTKELMAAAVNPRTRLGASGG